jgi:hypothetical protein
MAVQRCARKSGRTLALALRKGRYPCWTAAFTAEDRMAEIRVEQKRGGLGRAVTIAIGLVVIVGLVYYFLYYRNG